MRAKVVFDGVDVSESVKSKVEEKISKLDKFYKKEEDCSVVFKHDGLEYECVLQLRYRSKNFKLHIKHADLYKGVTELVELAQRKIAKQKDKRVSNRVLKIKDTMLENLLSEEEELLEDEKIS